MILLPANPRDLIYFSISDGWYSSIGNSEKLIGEVLHLRSKIYERWREFSRRRVGSSRELLRNLIQCLHRHCKKQRMCLIAGSSSPRDHPGNLKCYLHCLLEKLMLSNNISPDCLPSVILITLIRIKIIQQFPSSVSKDKSQNSNPELPRSSLKLLKEFNKIRPKVWKEKHLRLNVTSVDFRV